MQINFLSIASTNQVALKPRNSLIVPLNVYVLIMQQNKIIPFTSIANKEIHSDKNVQLIYIFTRPSRYLDSLISGAHIFLQNLLSSCLYKKASTLLFNKKNGGEIFEEF